MYIYIYICMYIYIYIVYSFAGQSSGRRAAVARFSFFISITLKPRVE